MDLVTCPHCGMSRPATSRIRWCNQCGRDMQPAERSEMRQEVIPERVIDALKWHNRQEAALLERLGQQEQDLIQIANWVNEALATDGAHHKQWYLAQIGLLCGLKIDWSTLRAVAP